MIPASSWEVLMGEQLRLCPAGGRGAFNQTFPLAGGAPGMGLPPVVSTFTRAYSVYFWSRLKRMRSFINCDCDEAAVREAAAHAEAYDIEVWDGDRFVAMIEKD
jgi:hypothetical protein